jgi:hypothetical protein
MPTPPDRNIPPLILPPTPRFQVRVPARLTVSLPPPASPPVLSFLRDAGKAAGFAVHTFLVDLLLVGETPLGEYLPFLRRMEPDDEVSSQAQQFGDIAAMAWGLTEAIAGIGLGLADVGIEGGLWVVPGGQLIAAPLVPAAAGVAVVATGLLVHGGLVAAVAGHHVFNPTQAMSKASTEGGGSRKEPVPGPSSAANATEATTARAIEIDQTQLQRKFKHAGDFGVAGNWSGSTATQFEQAIRKHVSDETTRVIQGSYRAQPVTHFYNPNTGLNVIRDTEGRFVSGWKLNAAQTEHLLANGRLGGG